MQCVCWRLILRFPGTGIDNLRRCGCYCFDDTKACEEIPTAILSEVQPQNFNFVPTPEPNQHPS
ncbi:MAG TPA: hypothetical protein VGF31_03060, partial [Myxococcaceae bacterium]